MQGGQNKKRKVLLFVGDNISGQTIVNKLIPGMVFAGFTPEICMTKTPPLQAAKVPALQDYSFYESTLLTDTVYPFLDEKTQFSPPKDKNKTPRQLEECGIAVHRVESVNDEAFVNRVLTDDDIIGGISVRNYQIFKQEIIGVFNEKGFLWNLHMGTLPQYRGVYIPARARANDESQYGWTLHKVDKEIDTGDVIRSVNINLDPIPVIEIYQGFVPFGVTAIKDALERLETQKDLNGRPQEEKEAKYYGFPDAEVIEAWRNKGIQLVDPNRVADMYVRCFAAQGTELARELAVEINTAIALHRNATPMLRPRSPSTNGPCLIF